MIKDYNFQIEQLKDIMKRSPIAKKKIPKITNYLQPPNSVQQWTFTPKDVVFRPKILKLLKRLINQKICVIFNVEIIRYLLDFGYKLKQITFISDCKDRTILAKSWGIKQVIKYTELSNKSKMIKNMKFTPIINPDFAHTSRFRKIAESIAHKYIILFSDTNHFSQNKNNYKNVEYIENLGKDGFPDAEVSTIVSIINVKKSQKNSLTIGDETGKVIKLDGLPKFLPPKNLDNFLWATEILNKGYEGYDWVWGDLELSKKNNILEHYFTLTEKDSIPLVFNIGERDSDKFGKILFLKKKYLHKATGLGKHKLVVSKNTAIGKLGALKYCPPKYGIGANAIAIYCNSKKDVLELINYLESDKVKKLITVIKNSGVVNNKGIISLIPKKEYEWN